MLIKVKVTVDAPAEKVVKKNDDLYLISVRQSASHNMANRRVLEIMRRIYVSKSVRLISGQRKSAKIIEIN